MQSCTFQVDEATLDKWTPLQIEALQVDQIGEVMHSSCSDEIAATETQRHLRSPCVEEKKMLCPTHLFLGVRQSTT